MRTMFDFFDDQARERSEAAQRAKEEKARKIAREEAERALREREEAAEDAEGQQELLLSETPEGEEAK